MAAMHLPRLVDCGCLCAVYHFWDVWGNLCTAEVPIGPMPEECDLRQVQEVASTQTKQQRLEKN